MAKQKAGAPDRSPDSTQLPGTNGTEGTNANPSLGLDDAELSSEVRGDDLPPLTTDPRLLTPGAGRQGDAGRPYCPKHNCLCKASGTKEHVTLYACPVAGCETREKRVRPPHQVPSQPQMCPQRSCEEVALEANDELSNLVHLHMVCPQCRFSLKVPRPQFDAAAAARARRREAEDLAAR